MITDLNEVLSDTAKRMKRSAIREILKLTANKEIISFAGGLPSPLTFPAKQLKEITAEILDNDADSALQYGTTEGDINLRELILKRYTQDGLKATLENIIITTASQQSLDLIPKIFINPGDKVICGLPSYLGGIGSFANYGADMIGIKFDDFGMSAKLLEATLENLKSKNEKPKFIYVIPDFQNPAGITMPESRRIEIINLAKKYDVIIIEDSPYRELRFEGEPQKTMYQLDGTGQVITLGTFSKIFVPGFRLGWVLADPAILDRIVRAKQSADLCTSIFTQKIAAKYMEKGYFEENLQSVIDMYKEKKEVMMDSFEKFMPKGVTWTNPEGGLFLFLNLPEGMDAEELFQIALKKNVAFVIGTVFHCDGSGKNTMRINFSYVSIEQLVEGVKRLATAIEELYAKAK